MRSLRLVGRPSGSIDRLLARTVARVVRSDGTLWVVPLTGTREELCRGLAFAGVGVRDEELPAPRADLVPMLGSDLAPAGDPAIEALTLQRLALGNSTVRVLGRRSLRRVWPSYRARRSSACRDLLRGVDELVRWERRAWLAPAALRAAGVRRSFRPIVFDRAALDSSRPGGVVHSSDGLITRWAFG